MGLWDRLVRRQDRVNPGRVTQPVLTVGTWLSPFRTRVTNALEELRSYSDEAAALLFLRKVHPDVSMAVWNFLRLANQGHEMYFYDLRDRERRLPRAEARWRDLAERVGEITNAGLDGLVDQLHLSAFLRGAMAVEVEVSSDLTDIVDVYPVKPQTITWKYEEKDGRKTWVPYQNQPQEVSLADANFFWVPIDPDIDDPRGNLVIGSVLQAVDFQMQILQDLQQVIHNQGWPRYDVNMPMDRVKANMPPDVKNNPKKQREWLEAYLEAVRTVLRSLKPDDSFVHWDDMVVTMLQGAANQRSLDVRAVMELLDTQLMSGAKQLAVFLNRNSGLTETWSTVQFRIFCSGLISVQRGSKRLMESIARLWLRVHGMQGIPKFTHNTVDWQSERDKAEVGLLKEQFWAIAQLMGWVSPDSAASEAVGVDRAFGSPVEGVRVSFSSQGGGVLAGTDDGKRNGSEAAPVLRPVPRVRGQGRV